MSLLFLSCKPKPGKPEGIYSLRVHHFLPPGSVAHEKMLLPFAEELEKESEGRLKLDIFPAMQLGGSPQDLYDQAAEGYVDIAWTVAGYTPNRFPITETFELPFMSGDALVTSLAIHDFSKNFLKEEYREVVLLAIHAHASGSFHSRTAIESIEDLRGLRIRAPNAQSRETLRALGANPVSMPVPELPLALSQGTLDAALIPFEVATPLKIQELVDSHVILDSSRGLYTTVFILVMNRESFADLPPDLQQILLAKSGEPLVRRAGAIWREAELEGIRIAEARGNTIVRWRRKELDEIRSLTGTVIDEWKNRNRELSPDLLVEEANRLLDSYSAELLP